MKHTKLQELLYNNEENDKKNEFNTESIYQSIGIDNNHNLPFYEENNLEIEIRNKLTKINNSLKSFNINLNHPVPGNFCLSSKFIFQILESIIELIWKLEEEYSIKINYISKISSLNLKIDEGEKKIKKLNIDINEYKKSHLEHLAETQKIRDKDYKVKSKNSEELNDLKVTNKRLIILTDSFKVEIKKKDQEIVKLKEKLKKLLSCNESNIKGGTLEIMNNNDSINKLSTSNRVIYPNNSAFEEKIKFLSDQNETLLNISRNFNGFVSKICNKLNNFYDNEDSFLNLVKIKDNLFSMHLIGKNLEDFETNFKNNISVFEKMFYNLIENCRTKNTNYEKNDDSINEELNSKLQIQDNQSMMNKQVPKPKKRDIIGKFKKWSLGTGNDNFIYNSATKKLQNDSRCWYENVDQEKKIVYEYNKENVIKGDSILNSEHN